MQTTVLDTGFQEPSLLPVSCTLSDMLRMLPSDVFITVRKGRSKMAPLCFQGVAGTLSDAELLKSRIVSLEGISHLEDGLTLWIEPSES